jgi:hypothetical protein
VPLTLQICGWRQVIRLQLFVHCFVRVHFGKQAQQAHRTNERFISRGIRACRGPNPYLIYFAAV